MRLFLLFSFFLLSPCRAEHDESYSSRETTSSLSALPDSPCLEVVTLRKAYDLCCQYQDLAAAAPLAVQLASLDTGAAHKWKGELAKIHFATNRHKSCLLILQDLAQEHPEHWNAALAEMQALCHEALGNKKEALEAWQALWGRSKSASHAVRVAGLQFDAKLLAEAEATITTALAAADAATTMIKLPKTREEMQDIPASAALHNLRALVILTRDPQNRQAARQELEKALEISPDYEIAKRNLAGLDEAKPPATE